MMTEICAEVRNYFEKEKKFGTFTVENGAFTPSFDIPGDYIRIVGSWLNDGVYKVSEMQLKDETFSGAIWMMAPPPAFIELCDDIAAWQAENGRPDSVAMSPFQSESFGGYSYSKGAATSADGSGAATWKTTFASRLNLYRRIKV